MNANSVHTILYLFLLMFNLIMCCYISTFLILFNDLFYLNKLQVECTPQNLFLRTVTSLVVEICVTTKQNILKTTRE